MNLESLFIKRAFHPNDAQRAAIIHEDGPLFLTAGPGSGKTHVLLWRTLNLLVFRDVAPSRIMLATFTEKAARQLKEGLLALLALVTNETGKAYDLSSISIGTVHSLCQKFLVDRRFSDSQSRKRAPVLLDELGQYFMLYNRRYWAELIKEGGFPDEESAQRAINAWMQGSDSYSRHHAVQACMAFFNRLSEENWQGAETATGDETLKSLLRMYARYKRDLATGKATERVDFSLLQQAAYGRFAQSAVAGSVFDHVIIDEYQDTNAIQEALFFALASGSRKLCVVGDDDQALYRFRGATVENLVDFESRCAARLGVAPRRIDLNVNYRSRKAIVGLYSDFIRRADWSRPESPLGAWRIADKGIVAASADEGTAVVTSSHAKAEDVYREIVASIKRLRESGAISDYNQAAFLFPAMKGFGGMNSRVHGFIEALKEAEIPYYAPRAGRFLEVEEARVFFGLCQEVFGRPRHRERGDASAGFREFQDWMAACRARAEELTAADPLLRSFVRERRAELDEAAADYTTLLSWAESRGLDLESTVQPGLPQRIAKEASLSLRVQKALQSHGVNELIKKRQMEGSPLRLRYLLNRVTAMDWGVLDLFYQLNGFSCFRSAYEEAESGRDEGPICNLGLITQYLARYTEEYGPVIAGQNLVEDRFVNAFFSSYLYALFRLGESEYENVDDPFPKGRVPFLTIHQAKGLEFPVVVLGSVYREPREASRIETTMRELSGRDGEPLDRTDGFDTMRAFYVALSRARSLLILPRFTHAKAASPAFKEIFECASLPTLAELDPATLPAAREEADKEGRSYSFTGDYLPYRKCPRNYMAFRKYGFVPSRGQSMFFGRLVHETIEDLHHLVMAKAEAEAGAAATGDKP